MGAGTRGIICYAGFDREMLWAQAKQCFIQAEDALPQRFASFLPLFPMELVQSMRYVGENGTDKRFVASNGFSIDPGEYHRQLFAEMPELYAGDNYRRNFDYEDRFIGRGAMTVDQAWVMAFPQYQPFIGERLAIYLIGGGGQAVAVPESVFPRGCGLLHSAETDLRIASRGEHYAAYVKKRVSGGEPFDAPLFEADYLQTYHLNPVAIRQAELGRVMQDMSIVKSLKEESAPSSLYTENAKRAEHIPQYAPYAVACDTFESAPTTRSTARLMQLYYANDDFISDLWLPYSEASEYINKRDMTLDVRALCHGFQLPPRYDPETGGGRYPDQARVAVVRDRELRPMVADALNNPAYGNGMSPLGLIHKWVLLPDSGELLRLRKLALEETEIRCLNLTVSPEEYLRMLDRAALQEDKGRLIDGMYRREAALSQMREGTPAYQRARLLLDQRVNATGRRVRLESRQTERAQLSGYDADLDYLRRMARVREEPAEEETQKALDFSHDPLRMMSIESGYAMRGGVYCCRYEELALPAEPQAEPEVDASAEDEPMKPETEQAGTEADAPEAAAAESEPEPEGEPEGETPVSEAETPEGEPELETPAPTPEAESEQDEADTDSPEAAAAQPEGEAEAGPEGEVPVPEAETPETEPESETPEAEPEAEAPASAAEPEQAGTDTDSPEPASAPFSMAGLVTGHSQPVPVTPVNKTGKMAQLLKTARAEKK